MSIRNEIEEFILKFPIYQYDFLDVGEIEFHDKIRNYCKKDCAHYNKSWSCPPAVGKPAYCQTRCKDYNQALFFSSVGQYAAVEKADWKTHPKLQHDKMTRIIENFMKKQGLPVYTLTSEACAMCRRCGFPREHCRHPEEMYPCIESHCIQVSDLVEKCGMDYYLDENLFLWFSIIFFRDLPDKVF